MEEAKREAEANAAAERERAANAHQARVAALEKHLERERAEREASTKSADEQLAALRSQASTSTEVHALSSAFDCIESIVTVLFSMFRTRAFLTDGCGRQV